MSRKESGLTSSHNASGDLHKKEISIGQKIFDIFKTPFMTSQDADSEYKIEESENKRYDMPL